LSKRRVLVLRPEPAASATVAKAREYGLDAVAIPLFKTEPVAWQVPEAARFDGLLLTSANAVRCAGAEVRSLRGLKTFAVGEATAKAAREAGFDIAATGDAGVDRLLDSLEPGLNLLHLCGADRRLPMNVKQQITPLVVYRSRTLDAPDLSDARGSAALIHSPRAGKRLAELVDRRDAIAIVAISGAAAAAVGGGWESVDVAEQPGDDALLALAARLCNNSFPK
jgi:uroporphyrinogen-III synthase